MAQPTVQWKGSLVIVFLLFIQILQAQPTQQIRGTVVDAMLQKPISGASVTLVNSQQVVQTNSEGSFKFTNLPIGAHRLLITHVGYKEALLENININSGKETVLTISMTELVHTEEAVVIKAKTRRNNPLNELSAVSARAFTVEETQKYAAAVNDPLRMATGFPGVVSADDGNNHIVIRGNAPTGLLWRMEGVDIPNPNHFGGPGASGGGISILSAQLLSNSDFVTGAFAAEYGNGLSGVFDLKLRRGNNEKKEYTLQAGVLGLNAAAEGPIMPFYKGSYLINYRYSTLALLDKVGVSITGGNTVFQDLSYNIYLPSNRFGTFTLFGFGGLSAQKIKAEKDSTKWESKGDRYNEKFSSNTGATGVTHSILLGQNTQLRSALAYSINEIGADEDFIERDYTVSDQYKSNYQTKKWTATSTLNHKVSKAASIRAGAIVTFTGFQYYEKAKENDNAPFLETINKEGNTQTVQAFAQWQYKLSERLALSAGAHYLQLMYNNTSSLEPRASMKYDVSSRSSIALGYGLHSQVQGLGVYFAERKDKNGNLEYPNKDLDLTKAHHLVASYNYLLGKNLRLKMEAYYQQLFDVPVSNSDTNTFSTLNIIDDYVTIPLVNKGEGRNYGLELSLEKYLSKNFYYTISNSFYQSKYTAADGIERNTRFNGNYTSTFMAGKDFISSNGLKTFGMNIKTIYAGGFRTTPIDMEKSVKEGYTIFKQKEAFSLQNPAYFRTDLRLSLKWNRRHHTSTLSLDIQNLTNRLNIYNEVFDSEKGKLVKNYQTGLIPILNYKIEF